jgi:error-prone DNA polymerase
LRRTDLTPGDARLLIKAGCFDAIEGESSRPGLLWKLLAHEKGGRGPAPTLFEPPPAELPCPPGYDERTMLRHEAEVLGFLMSRHPLELHLPLLKPLSYVPGKDLERWVGKRVTCVGWFVTGKLVETKQGEPMEFLSFEDTTAIYETTFFPGAYRRFCSMIGRDRPFLLRGLVEEDFGAVTLTVADARPLEPPGRGARPTVRVDSRPSMVYP